MIHIMHLITTLMIASEVDGLVKIIISEEVTREENFYRSYLCIRSQILKKVIELIRVYQGKEFFSKLFEKDIYL